MLIHAIRFGSTRRLYIYKYKYKYNIYDDIGIYLDRFMIGEQIFGPGVMRHA